MNLNHSDKFRSSNNPNLLIGALLLFILAISIVIFGFGAASIPFIHHDLGGEFVICTLLIGILLILTILFWSRYRGYFDPFELPVWISLNVYLFVLFNVLLDSNPQIAIPWLNIASQKLWGLTAILFGVGLCSMWVGYIIAYPYLSRKKYHIPENRSFRPKPAFVIWFFSAVVSIIALITGVQGYLGSRVGYAWENYIAIIQYVGWAAWSALLFHHLSKPTKIGWFWIFISLAIGIITNFIGGTKSVVLWFVYVIMHIFYLKRKISIRWLILALILFFLSIPTVNATRIALHNLADGGEISFLQRVSAVSESLSSKLNTSPISLIDQTFTTLSTRQASIFQVSASVLSIHPSKTHYVGIEMAEALLYQVIPRFIWPGKRVGESSIYKINELYYGLPVQGLAAIGIFADSYRVAGWFFVIFFFVVFGGGLAWLYWQGPARKSNYGTVFYLTMLVWVISYERSILSMFVFYIEHGLIIYLVSKFLLFGPESRA
jgi:hypothetical protein